MSNKRNRWLPLASVLIALTATVAQAQSIGQTGELERPLDTQAAEQRALERQKTALAGIWMGAFANGNRTLITFNADGTLINNVQGGISTDPARPTHTSHHGVWRHLGGRQFGATMWDIIYDVYTGQLLQYTKIRLEVTLGESGDEASARSRVEFLNPQGEVVRAFSSTANYRRIPYEPLE
jgi:hypothetical protein